METKTRLRLLLWDEYKEILGKLKKGSITFIGSSQAARICWLSGLDQEHWEREKRSLFCPEQRWAVWGMLRNKEEASCGWGSATLCSEGGQGRRGPSSLGSLSGLSVGNHRT